MAKKRTRTKTVKAAPRRRPFEPHTLLVGEKGRVVLPAKVRKALGIDEGDYVVVSLKDESVNLLPLKVAARRAQGMYRHLLEKSGKTAEQVIDEVDRE